jgi:hypothetical protein
MEPSMLTDTQISSFHRDGYLNGGRILNDGEVQQLIDELEGLLARGPDSFAEGEAKPVLFHNMARNRDPESTVWQIVNIWEVCEAYKQLIYHPFIVEAISQLTGTGDLMVWRCDRLASGCTLMADHSSHDACIRLDCHG